MLRFTRSKRGSFTSGAPSLVVGHDGSRCRSTSAISVQLAGGKNALIPMQDNSPPVLSGE